MSNNNPPIKYSVILEIKNFGVNQNLIKRGNISMESDRVAVITEDHQIRIIDIKSKKAKPMKVTVDAAIMNPTTNVLGLRENKELQIFNLDMETRIKRAATNDVVTYWKWLDNKTIAYVTVNAVYHWSMEGNKKPEKKFDIQNDDRKVQTIGYNASKDGNWLVLQGITNGQNGIEGVLQLYSVQHGRFQPKMNGYGACFAYLNINGRYATLFCFTRKENSGNTSLYCVEVGNPDAQNVLKVHEKIEFTNPNDFMISMVVGPKYGCLYGVSHKGFLFIFDIQTCICIFKRQIANSVIVTAPESENDGIIILNGNGRVASFCIDSTKYVEYITNVLDNPKLAVKIATQFNLTGADSLFNNRFNQLMNQGKYSDAAKLAALAPLGVLRTQENILKLQNAPTQQGITPPDLEYFQLLLKEGNLNKSESIHLCQRMLQFNPNKAKAKAKIEKFLTENKLTNSEELGNVLAKYDPKLACSVFYRAKIPSKTILCFIQLGQSSKIIQYCKSENYTPKWSDLLVHVQQMKRDHVKDFAQSLVDNNYLTAKEVVDVLLGGQRNDIEKTTEFLLDYLQNRDDSKDDSELQTLLLEINLESVPEVANAIMESDEYKLSHYDRHYIAKLCENAQLYERALDHYESLQDIKRVLHLGLNTKLINTNFILKYFGDLTPEDALSCLEDLLQYNNSNTTLQLVVKIANQYSEQLTSEKVIILFEKFKCFQGLYLYLGRIVNFTKNSEYIFKYIEAAALVGQFAQIELICRENNYYDPKQLKTYLIESNKVKDPRPLIHVCDRHGFIDELTKHLYTNQMYRFIEVYVQKMNPGSTPKVVGSLLDLNAPEDQIRNLINMVRPPQCPIKELVDEVESRARLTLLLPWLETRFNEGSEDPALHNALAKIYIDINNNPQQFLMSNKFYDSKIVGKYCESRDPHLAFIAYKRAWGSCDEELITVTSKHGFFKDQARYCVERQDASLWKMVLSQENKDRRSLVDQVVATALPESRNPDEISSAVKAFMKADLPNELIELLEKIVLSQSGDYNFRNNKNLQNLLMITAIKADPTRVAGYIDRLDNYDGPEIAKICISDQNKLYEEGFLIYKKFKKGVEAINVLLYDIKDIERGSEFAAYWDKPNVWSILGKSQLNQELTKDLKDDFLKDAIESFLKANDAQYYADVIIAANKRNSFNDLIKFLQMARDKVRDKAVDQELIYAFAKIEDLASLEKFIGQPHGAILDKVGDRCFDEELYPAAKIIYIQINNHAKLASTLVKLGLFQEAVDAAIKANSIQTWKDVCYACVEASKFRLAQMCGVHIIVFMDHLQDLITHYEIGGHFAELINLLEQGINLDRAHQGIYTQLGILYAKYKETKLMEHINLFWSRLNIPTLLQACKDNYHWKEAVFLYTCYDQYNNAIDTIIQHSPSCWNHKQFKGLIIRVNNTEVFYRAINFYLKEHPLLLSELLVEISSKLDHKRVVHTIQISGQIPLIKKYLQYIQRDNNSVVNEALNELFIQESDYKSLRESIDEYNAFDPIALAQTLQKHNLLEFRRIAAYLYKVNKRMKVSIELSKKDQLWQDAMETAAASEDTELAEELLRFFVNTQDCPKACFVGCLFTCNKLIRPDVVLELAWRNNLMEFVMPYMIQTFRTFNNKLDFVNKKIKEQEMKDDEEMKKIEEAKEQENSIILNQFLNPGIPMITAPGYGIQNNIQYMSNNNNNNGFNGGF